MIKNPTFVKNVFHVHIKFLVWPLSHLQTWIDICPTKLFYNAKPPTITELYLFEIIWFIEYNEQQEGVKFVGMRTQFVVFQVCYEIQETVLTLLKFK